MMESAPEVLKRVVEVLGSATEAAKILGKTPQAVSDILRRGRPAPPDWCIPLERAIAEKIAERGYGEPIVRSQMRPDIYPPEEVAA